MALNDLTRISTSGIATGSTIDSPILRKDVDFRGDQVGITSVLFDSSDNSLNFVDNTRLKIGDSGDLQLYHNALNSWILDQGTGQLVIGSNGEKIRLSKGAGAESLAEFFVDGSVILYHDGNEKFKTTNHGAVVTGILTATGFRGPLSNASGISTFYDLRVTNNLTVEGTTTTLDTNLIGVDRIEVGADSNSVVGVAVTQSGTADIVNLFDGGTNVLTVTDTGDVGIGTDNPQEKLHITQTGNPKILIEDTDSSNQVGVRFKTTTQDWIAGLHGGISSFKISKDSSFGSNDYLTINSAGNVGIGSATPGRALTIQNSEPRIRLQKPNLGHGEIYIDDDNSINLSADSSSSVGTSSIIFRTNGAEKVRIKEDKVGIGTDNPGQKLDIFNGADDPNIIIVKGADTSTEYAGVGVFQGNATFTGGGIGGTNAGISLRTADGGTETERVRITSDGKVGIGTDNLTQATGLTVYRDDTGLGNIVNIEQDGTGDAVLGFAIKGIAAWQFGIDNSDSDKFKISYDGSGLDSSTSVTLDRSGNVGIGTDNPASRLEVQDDASTGIIVRCTNTQSTHTNKALRVRNNSDTNTFSVSHRGQLFVKSVGIGTASPSAPLHISGTDSNGTKIKLEDNNNGFAASEIYVQNGGRDLRFAAPQDIIFTKIGGSTLLYLENGNNVGIGTDNPFAKLDVFGNTRLRGDVDIDGQVGIGTDTPSELLDVYKTSNDAVIKTRTTAAGAYFEADSAATEGYHGIRLSSSGTQKWFLGSYNSANFQIKDGSGASGAERFTIEDDSGNIGIGTDNPVSSLHIWSTGPDIMLTDFNQAANNRNWILTGAVSQVLRIQAQNDSYAGGGNLFDFYRSGNQVNEFRGMNSGNYWFTVNNSTRRIGIGTTNPGYSLEIGNILSNNNIKIGNRITGSDYGIAYGYYDNLSGDHGFGIDLKNGGTLTTNAFVVRAGSGNVGINETNPSSKLTIKDETGGQSLLIEGASGNDVVVLGSVNGATNRGELLLKEGTTGQEYVKFSSKASTPSYIMNNNLGIGTQNPGTKLDVFGNFQVKDSGGRQNFFISETNFNVAQTNTGWTNTSYDVTPIIKWSWISAVGDHLYFASGGNTPPADQACMILSDQHGFKFGRSGWDGASNTNLSTEYFRIKMDGRVGIGTDDPKTKYLQVGATAGGLLGNVFTATPLVAIAPDNLGGTAGDSHKIAIFGGQTTGNCSGLSIYHYRRVNGTDWTTDGFSFRQEVDNTSGIYNYMTFAAGKVGINQTNPAEKLEVSYGHADVGIVVSTTDTFATGNSVLMQFREVNTIGGSIAFTNGGTTTAYVTSSDYRLKENITPLTNAITRLKTLKPYRFNFIKTPDITVDGFLAHEVTAVPEAVTGEKDAMRKIKYTAADELPEGKNVGDFKEYSTTEIDPQGVDYAKITPLLTAALQEAITEIETLKAKVAALEG